MAAYVIADIQVTDPTSYDRYRPLAAASVARFGGRFVVRGGKVDLLKAHPSRSGSSSSNFPMLIPPSGGTALRNTRPR
jgi:uncharacterized protein (DUF1330 family)